MRILNMKRLIVCMGIIALFAAGQLMAAEQWTDVEKTINKEEKRAVSDAALTQKRVCSKTKTSCSKSWPLSTRKLKRLKAPFALL